MEGLENIFRVDNFYSFNIINNRDFVTSLIFNILYYLYKKKKNNQIKIRIVNEVNKDFVSLCITNSNSSKDFYDTDTNERKQFTNFIAYKAYAEQDQNIKTNYEEYVHLSNAFFLSNLIGSGRFILGENNTELTY